jgi:putative ABC transport system permease protein
MLSALEGAIQDVRFGTRSLRRHPGFAFAAVLAAALGIGASTAVFSAVDRILFRSLPYGDAERLTSVGIMAPLDSNEFLLADGYVDLRRNPGPFEAVTSFEAGNFACDLTEQHPVRLRCLRAEANFLSTLGVSPIAGRAFTAEEDRPNGPKVAMISYALWRGRFGQDSRITGRTLNLDGVPVMVTGVLPAGFLMPTLTGVDVLLPLALDESREHSGRAFRAFGRLKRGVSIEQAQVQLQAYLQRVLATVPPRFRKEVSLRVRDLRDRQVGSVRQASLTMLGAVLAVLLIACANIANLLLARAAGREREMTVRRALGAPRWRIVRQVMTESLLVGIAGGVAGCGVSYVLLRLFQSLGPNALPRLQEATLDVRVMGFALAASLVSALLFGLAPALGKSTWPAGSGRIAGSSGGWLRGGLVTAQVALSLMLLTGAGLLLRSLWNLQSVPLGMESEHVLTAKFVLGRQRYATPQAQVAFFSELERKLAGLPGVQSAAITDSLPPSGGTRARPLATIDVEGQAPRAEGTGGMVPWRYVTPGYFGALGIPLRRGRGFSAEDRAAGTHSVVVNESFARQLLGGAEAVGKQIRCGEGDAWCTIIVVAADARNVGFAKPAAPEFYLVRKLAPDATFANAEPPLGWRAATAIVRTGLDPRLAAGPVRSAIGELDGTLPVELETMSQRLDQLTEQPRFYAVLLGVFAASGVVLAAIGLFGVLSFLVAQRRREIGVRIALGATPRQIAALTLAFAARWTGAGLIVGGLGALVIGRWLRSLLFGVDAGDLRGLLVAGALLAVVAAATAANPARRAARMDPMESLREE